MTDLTVPQLITIAKKMKDSYGDVVIKIVDDDGKLKPITEGKFAIIRKSKGGKVTKKHIHSFK